MLAAPSPTSVAFCYAAACGSPDDVKVFKVIKDLKVPNDFFFRKSLKKEKADGVCIIRTSRSWNTFITI